MTDMREFDIFECPLDGSHLIEASAGTGKTHTITNLFVRLVLEKRLSVESILVVTFTEAATAELRDRIRARLRKAWEVLAETSEAGSDTFLSALPGQFSGTARAEAIQRLRVAVNDFDRVAVFTIHGFCLRALQENAFESGSLFDSELVTDQRAFRREVAEDYWRLRFTGATPLFVNWAADGGVSGPESLLDLAGRLVIDPRLEIVPEATEPDTTAEERAFLDALDAVRDAWPAARGEVETLLLRSGFNRRKVPVGKIPGWLESFDALRDLGRDDCALFPDIEKFTQEAVDASMNKGQAPPRHPFFELCGKLVAARDALDGAFAARLLALRADFLDTFQREVDARKERRNVLFFDDLLLRLYRALEGPGGPALASAMRRSYQAALIDEFQDTDTVQYAIFGRLFNHEGGTLFLIGDPKQAIYGFRGADIFAYMEASRDVPSRFTLKENWRSEPALVRGVNAVFGAARRPFVYDEIPFAPVLAAAGKAHEGLTVDGAAEAPFRLWLLEARAGDGDFVKKGAARGRITRAVAGEVARLIRLGREGRLLLGGRTVREGDLAVLVRKNDEARRLQAAFSDLGVHSVVYSTENLFDSVDAREMERLLAGIVNPADAGALRAAMATDLLGMRGEELARLGGDEAAWDAWLVRFADWRDEWEGRGFFRMFRRLLAERGVLPRLMALPDGERRCTNVSHLSEVLHQASLERNLGMAALHQWLVTQRDERTPRMEEDQLRLESDERAVRIITIHKSKGLEYPIVFCPFAWDGLRRDDGGPVLFHDERRDRRLTLDLGSADRAVGIDFAMKEQFAENLRLLYVALTRARSRCSLVWGLLNEAETSAPAYLLHQPEDAAEGTLREETAARYRAFTPGAFREDLDRFAAAHTGAVAVEPMAAGGGTEPLTPPAADGENLAARVFRGRIDRSWRVMSFSSLARRRARSGDDGADRDEAVTWTPPVMDAVSGAGGMPEADGARGADGAIWTGGTPETGGPGSLDTSVGVGGIGPTEMVAGVGEITARTNDSGMRSGSTAADHDSRGGPGLSTIRHSGGPSAGIHALSDLGGPGDRGDAARWSTSGGDAIGRPDSDSGVNVPMSRDARSEANVHRLPGPGTEAVGSIFDFPAGADSGIFLHEVFETLDFQWNGDESLVVDLRKRLAAHGFEPEWAPVVASMVRNVLDTSLDADVPDLRLSRIPASDRLAELEFTFPLKRLTPRALDHLLATWMQEGARDPLGAAARPAPNETMAMPGSEKESIGEISDSEPRDDVYTEVATIAGHGAMDHPEPLPPLTKGGGGGFLHGAGSSAHASAYPLDPETRWPRDPFDEHLETTHRETGGLNVSVTDTTQPPAPPHPSGDRFTFDPVQGYLKGFIDLVFQFRGRYYLIDWKSNHLGGTSDAYTAPNLARAMEEHLYTLQCAIYIAALDRYLQTRIPGYRYEDHFGGAYYLFLRGITPETGPTFGIHRTRPPADVVQELAASLIDADGAPGR